MIVLQVDDPVDFTDIRNGVPKSGHVNAVIFRSIGPNPHRSTNCVYHVEAYGDLYEVNSDMQGERVEISYPDQPDQSDQPKEAGE